MFGVRSGLEKSSVLPVLDRFLSLKTDFVLNRKQKNRSIKVRFFRPILNDSLYFIPVKAIYSKLHTL